jgi:hypothetical protein
MEIKLMKCVIYSAVVTALVLGLSACDSETSTSQKESAAEQQTTTSTQPEATAAEKPKMASSTSGTTKVLWGDTHNHTGNSFDVYLFGTPTSTPETAYRFAKGLPVINPATGTRWQLSRPLDFLVVADHAEMMGAMPRLYSGDKLLTETKSGKKFVEIGGDQSEKNLQRVYDIINYANSNAKNEANLTQKDLFEDLHTGDKRVSAWEEYIKTTEAHNEPGKFTALIGWEWTSTTGGANLHRVIFMPQGGDVAKQFIPYSTLESDDPEKLWAWLDETSKKTGAEFVAIPHNPNISLGKFFPLVRNNGQPVDAEYAKTRMKWERNVETTQIKGDSETHPALSPNDEFADFETYDFALTPDGTRAEPTKADYVRSGLKRGLELEAQLGTNPYKVGMIGSTDAHTGIAGVEENNFTGKGQHDATPEQRSHLVGLGSAKGWDMGAAGYVAVWAKANTRQDIVDAFQRKEVYASTGPRITLRFFGGYDFAKSDLTSNSFVETGYAKGVPMGGDLKASKKAPTFMIVAEKDPDAANLDRIQIIKGWLGADGKSQEKIYNVALSDGRSDGSIPVGNTVDLKTGKYSNTIGDPQLQAFWQDPDFDATQRAFYYVRVLEIPTPRYSLLDSIALGIDVKETGHPATIQERVYSSPIWYTP